MCAVLMMQEIRKKIKRAGLRPTKQRMAIAECILPPRHFSVEQIHMELIEKNQSIALSTVYNTVRQFLKSGLIREYHLDGVKSMYDSNLEAHHHFYDENTGRIYDISTDVSLSKTPKPPKGYEIDRVDIIVRLKRQ